MEIDVDHNKIQEYKLVLDGFPDLVSALTEFFDEEAPSEIVMYKPNLRTLEPAYCKTARIGHNKKIEKEGETCKVVKEYNIASLREGEQNSITVTILLKEDEDIGQMEVLLPEETQTKHFNFDSFIYRGHSISMNSPSNPIEKLGEKVKNLSLEDKESKKRTLPKQVADTVWMKYESLNNTIGKCYCCGGEIKLIPRNYEVSHIVSRHKGGKDEISNLRPTCISCNRSMGTQDMRDYMRRFGYDKTNSDCFLTL